jgi:elongation factor Ts
MELGKDEFKVWTEDEIKNNLIVKIGENLQLGEFDILEGEVVGHYLHSNKKVAGVAILSGGNEEVARDIAMHIAAFAPKYARPEDVPAEIVDKEKDIYAEQLKAEGKPAEIIEKIMTGKVDKFYTEVCLIKQPFVKDDKMSVEKVLADNNATLVDFKYYSL